MRIAIGKEALIVSICWAMIIWILTSWYVVVAEDDSTTVSVVDVFGFTEPTDISVVVDSTGQASFWRYRLLRGLVFEARAGVVGSDRLERLDYLSRAFLSGLPVEPPGGSASITDGEPFRLVVSRDGGRRLATGVLSRASDPIRGWIDAAVAIGRSLTPVVLAHGYIRLIPIDALRFASLATEHPDSVRAPSSFNPAVQSVLGWAGRNAFQMQPLGLDEYEALAAWQAGPIDRLLADGAAGYALELFRSEIAQ